MNADDHIDVEICSDCLIWFANADGNPDHDEDEHEAWLDTINARLGAMDLSLGATAERHDTPCGSFDSVDGQFLGGDCYCETIDFSMRSCDTCGDRLGGARHKATLFAS